MNSSINWIFLEKVPIQNHLNVPITDEIRPNTQPEIP